MAFFRLGTHRGPWPFVHPIGRILVKLLSIPNHMSTLKSGLSKVYVTRDPSVSLIIHPSLWVGLSKIFVTRYLLVSLVICPFLWVGLSIIFMEFIEWYIALLLIPFRSGRNDQNFLYRYANQYWNTPVPSRVRFWAVSGHSSHSRQFRQILAEMQISAGTRFGLLL